MDNRIVTRQTDVSDAVDNRTGVEKAIVDITTAPLGPKVTPAVGIRAVLCPRILWTILNYAFLAFSDQCVVVLVPLVYSTSIPLGGLGFSSFTIGVVQGVAGCIGGVAQIFAFPWAHRKLGSKWLYTISYGLFFFVFALFPPLSLVTKRAGRVGAASWVLIVVQFVMYLGTYMTWGEIQFRLPPSPQLG